MPCDYLFRVTLAGNSGVGKSSYVRRFVDRAPPVSTHGTIGVDFGSATVVHAGVGVKLHFWDTAGQKNYRKIVRAYFRAAHGVLLFYDVTDRESFTDLVAWLREIDSAHGGCTRPPVVIVGAKTDLTGERVVTLSEAVAFAMREGCAHEEVSAGADDNIASPITRLTAAMYDELYVPGPPSGASRALLPGAGYQWKRINDESKCCCRVM